MKKIYVDNSEKNNEDLRALGGCCVHRHMKRACDGNSEENHEDIMALDGCCVHWHMKKFILTILRKMTKTSGP
jgi:hypothetical protein